MEDFIAIAKAIKPSDVIEHLMPSLLGLCNDKSWRVRYMVADKFVSVDLN